MDEMTTVFSLILDAIRERTEQDGETREPVAL